MADQFLPHVFTMGFDCMLSMFSAVIGVEKSITLLCSPSPVEKQQTSLTEWCKVREGVPRQETQRDKVATRILQENDLLDDGGDGVFSQLVTLTIHCSSNCFVYTVCKRQQN